MNRRQLNQTLDILSLVLMALGLVLRGFPAVVVFALAGLLVFGSSVLPNPLTDFVARAWLALSKIVGRIASFVLLALVFYLVLTPVAFLFRLFNKELADSFFSRKPVSLLRPVAPGDWDKESFLRTW